MKMPLAVQGKSRCELYAGDLGKFGRLTFVRLPPNKYGDFRVSDREGIGTLTRFTYKLRQFAAGGSNEQ